jgi:hypothetical protein
MGSSSGLTVGCGLRPGSLRRPNRSSKPPRDQARICTSYVERDNLDVRMKCRRFTRLTNAFSKLWRNHRAAVALSVAHYNLCTMHRTIRMTPAMKAGLTNRPWSVADLRAA